MLTNVFDEEIPKKNSIEKNVFATFLQTKGLYDSIEINQENIEDLIILLDGQVRISLYCQECKAERVFTMEPYTYYAEVRGEYAPRKLSTEVLTLQKMIYNDDYLKEHGGEWQWKNWQIDEVARVIVFQYICSMDTEHHLDYVVLVDNHSFMKIGQYPSIADLTFPMLDVYNKVMNKDDRKEFGRAIGLYASGIGAGAYVYLRRIFERILLQAKEKAGDAINESEFEMARVDEKIKMLSDYLPEMLTKNKVLYGILSKGIHELSEEDCVSYFPVVRDCIFMILDNWEKKREKEEKEKSIGCELARIAESIT